MNTPTEWAGAVVTVAAIYAPTGRSLGPRRRQDPVLWIGASMAGVLLIGGLVGPAFGERVDLWHAVAGIALGTWAWRRWRTAPASLGASPADG